MASSGNGPGTKVPDLYGPVCMCNDCNMQGRCRSYNLYVRDCTLAWVNGKPADA